MSNSFMLLRFGAGYTVSFSSPSYGVATISMSNFIVTAPRSSAIQLVLPETWAYEPSISMVP